MRGKLALRLKPLIAAKAKEKQGERTDLKKNENIPQIFGECAETNKQPVSSTNAVTDSKNVSPAKESKHENETDAQVAKIANVSRETMRKVEKIEESATPEVKSALESGDLSINAAYNKVKQAERKQDIQRQIEQIEQKAIEKPDGLFDVANHHVYFYF